MADTGKTTKRKRSAEESGGLSADEKAAMKERVEELKRSKSGKADGEADVLAKIAEMPDDDRTIAERIHAIVKEVAPELSPKTWYGMPAYAGKDGKAVCFFQSAHKFKARYATLGFNDPAKLDDGSMWPTSFAIRKLTSDDDKRLAELIKKAVS